MYTYMYIYIIGNWSPAAQPDLINLIHVGALHAIRMKGLSSTEALGLPTLNPKPGRGV